MKLANLSVHFISVLFLLSSLPVADAQDDAESKVKLLPSTPQMEAVAAKAMQGCEPRQGKVTGEINQNGVYTLTSNLFHDGRVYAIIDDNEDVILCERQQAVWQPVSAINVHTVWNYPPGYREPQVERGSDDQPRPFWMLDLQKRPLLVIASDVEKAGQNF